MRIERYEQIYQFYIIPVIIYTYDKHLFGWYSIDIVWGKWGLSFIWGEK